MVYSSGIDSILDRLLRSRALANSQNVATGNVLNEQPVQPSKPVVLPSGITEKTPIMTKPPTALEMLGKGIVQKYQDLGAKIRESPLGAPLKKNAGVFGKSDWSIINASSNDYSTFSWNENRW